MYLIVLYINNKYCIKQNKINILNNFLIELLIS